MSFETYLSKVRTLSRQERLQNLIEQLEQQFNGDVDQIIQYLSEQGNNYHLAQELLRHFSPTNHQNNSPLFGQTVTSSKSVQSYRVLSSIYSHKPSQRPTPRPKSDESTSYNKTPFSSANQSNMTSYRRLNGFSSIYTPDKPKLRIETQTTCTTDLFPVSVQSHHNPTLEHIQRLIIGNDIYHALQEINKYKQKDPSLNILVAQFQCYYVLRDKTNAKALCQQLMKDFPDEPVISQVQLEMLIFYLSRILKTDHKQDIVKTLIEKVKNSLEIGNLTQLTKFSLLELKYMILEDFDITENIQYLAQLNSDDAKYQRETFTKAARILYESSQTSFKSVLNIILQEQTSNPDSQQSRIIHFLHQLISLSSKNQNIKQFKICSNLFVGWAAKEHIIYSIKFALEICSKSIQFLLQHFNSFSLVEQDFTLKSIFKIIQNQFSAEQQSKECLFSLAVQCGKFYYKVSLDRSIEFLKIAFENESYPNVREGELLKFKLIHNILQIGTKIKGFDPQKYYYETEKILASKVQNVQKRKFLQAQDKAIIHNELANCLQRSGQIKIAVQHYQKAVGLLNDQPIVKSKIQQNLRQCRLKIK